MTRQTSGAPRIKPFKGPAAGEVEFLASAELHAQESDAPAARAVPMRIRA